MGTEFQFGMEVVRLVLWFYVLYSLVALTKGDDMAKTFDFDKFEAEHKAEPLIVHNLFGQDWELPGVGQIPAREMLRAQRKSMEMMKLAKKHKVDLDDPESEVPAELVPFMLEMYEIQMHTYLGKENVEAWHEKGITDEALKAILDWAMTEHGLGEPEESEGEGEA